MNVNVVKTKDAGGTVYTVFVDGARVGTVARGWLRLGGDQWVACLSDRAPFGERTLEKMWKRIDREMAHSKKSRMPA